LTPVRDRAYTYVLECAKVISQCEKFRRPRP
jgi:hypothetical protein